MSRGRLEQGGKVWVADRVTQADQGNYSVRDDQAKVLSFSTLRVQGEMEDDVFEEADWLPLGSLQ